jgi:hypothetical protein
MTTPLRPVPSPRGTNNERLFFLPAGISPSAAAAALDAAFRSPMAMDAAPAFARRRRPARLTQDNPLDGYARPDEELSKADLATHELLELLSTLAPEQREKAEQLLTFIKEQAEAPERASVLEEEEEEVAGDGEGAEEMTDEDRDAYEVAIRALEKTRPGAIPEFQKSVRDHYGVSELPRMPKNGMERLGGRVHDQARRQREEQRARVAFVERFPDAARMDGAAVESYYGAHPSASFEPISEGTLSRWGEADRIKHT